MQLYQNVLKDCEVRKKMSTTTYPRFVEIDRNGIFQKVFTTDNGNEEFCTPTGRELQEVLI